MAQSPEPIRINTFVRYHGSIPSFHSSDWIVIGWSRDEAGLPCYELEDIFGDRLLNVRHTSITPL